MRVFRSIAFCAATLLVTAVRAAADPCAGIDGTVLSASSEPIAGAAVTLTCARQTQRATADPSGIFHFQAAVGTCKLDVRAAGYQPVVGRAVASTLPRQTVIATLQAQSVSNLAIIGDVRSGNGQSVSDQAAPAVRISHDELQNASTSHLSDILFTVPALTPIRPSGGDRNAPFAVALRGPDPTETLVAIDGHQINTGANGTFDLSLIDPSVLQDVELVYGIAPSSLVGPDTIGGAVNIRTLDPTLAPHTYAHVAVGSFNAFSAGLQATGTQGHFGYAAALGRYVSDGDVSQQGVGNSALAQSALLKARYTFSGDRSFAQLSLLNQSAIKDVSAALSSVDAEGNFNGFAGSNARSHDALYGLDLHIAAASGSVTLRHAQELDSQSVTGPAANFSPYFFNYRDAVSDDSLQYDRAFGDSSITAKYSVRSEQLNAPYRSGPLSESAIHRRVQDDASATPSAFTASQVQRSFALRYLLDSSPHLHYSAALYQSNFTSFGTSFDPRFGFVWTPTLSTAVRFSVGSTFQAPQLTALYVPSPLPAPDANGSDGLVSIGNPGLQADRATEYDLGFAHLFTERNASTHVTVDAYQSNLRSTIQIYVPDARPGYTFPINIGDLRYRGIEAQVEQRFGAYDLHAQYAINSAFPLNVPANIASATLVAGQQVASVPLHRASLQLQRSGPISFGIRAVYEDGSNELNRPAFALLDAHVSARLQDWNLTLGGTNLTNVYAQRFTQTAGGVPYPGADGPVATDAYCLPARALTLTISKRS